jgi:transcriptional regulator with XRE-family HTH domain
MSDLKTWRELLRELIENAQERQRIASLSGINVVTLQRWANNEGNPRVRNLHQLVAALPGQAEQLTRLIQKEYVDFLETGRNQEEDLTKIPSSFYTSVMRAYTKTAPSLRFWSIGKLILQQALQQLDPQRTGLLVTINGCTTPCEPEQKVRSLRIFLGQGSEPWQGNWDRHPMFMGVESLSGYVVSNRRLVSIQDTQNLDRHVYYPRVPLEHERSVAVAPIQRGESIAGCFYVSSTQAKYFTPERLELLQNYAQLVTVAFTPAEFYRAGLIELALFSEQREQEKYFATFQQRLLETMRGAILRGEQLSSQQATQRVMVQLEEELLQLGKKKIRKSEKETYVGEH